MVDLKKEYEDYRNVEMKLNNIACSERLVYDLKQLFKGDISFVYDKFAQYTKITINWSTHSMEIGYEYINNFNYDEIKDRMFHYVISAYLNKEDEDDDK